MLTMTRTGLWLDGVTAGYGKVIVLRDVSLVVPAGEVVTILGANGAGKTTLLRTILGTTNLLGGSITLDGEEIGGRPTHRLARAGVCYIPEGRAIYRSLSVEENLRLFAGKGYAEALGRIEATFPVLVERLRQKAGTMSGGQQQILALARALVRPYKLLLVDELSMGLAPVVIDELFEVLETLKSTGLTTVVVEQYAERALGLAEVAYVMSRGQVVLAGESLEFRDSPELLALYLESGDSPA
jgi:branched-chain amino acid transport system ATP-binding protein